MKVPWVLRWELMLAALKGEFVQISIQPTQLGAVYVFQVRGQSLKRWLERRREIREAATAAEEEEQQ